MKESEHLYLSLERPSLIANTFMLSEIQGGPAFRQSFYFRAQGKLKGFKVSRVLYLEYPGTLRYHRAISSGAALPRRSWAESPLAKWPFGSGHMWLNATAFGVAQTHTNWGCAPTPHLQLRLWNHAWIAQLKFHAGCSLRCRRTNQCTHLFVSQFSQRSKICDLSLIDIWKSLVKYKIFN